MMLRQKHAVLAAVTVATVFAGGVAQAQSYDRYGQAPAPHYDSARYGSADPCRRTAGNRALGWGIAGLVAGGFAGGAVAAAGVVAEGAALGALAGSVIGAKAGAASAACETAAYWNHPAYRSYQDGPSYDDRQYGSGYGYDRDYGRDYERPPATYYERRSGPNSYYEYRSSYSSSTSYDGRSSYDGYRDRSPCCYEPPRRESYERETYRPYERHEHYDYAPSRRYEDGPRDPREAYDRRY